MIKNIKHKGLNAFFNENNKKGIPAVHLKKITRILTLLNASIRPEDMNLSGFDLHRLSGKRKDTWSITISGNWRITFKFSNSDAVDVDFEDYH